MPFLATANSDLHYTDAGDGEIVFLLHGRSAAAACWDWHIERLRHKYRVIAFDSVNHGYSSNSPRNRPEPDRVEELDAVLAAFDVERPILVGQSMGAMTSLRWAVKYPGRARAVVGSGMGWPIQDFDPSMGIVKAKGGPVAAGLDDGLWLRSNNFSPAYAASHPEVVEQYARIRSTATAIEAFRNPRGWVMADPSWADSRLGDRLATMDTPLLLFIGGDDVLVDAARNVASIVPASRIEIVEGSDHNAYLEHIDRFIDLVDEHIAKNAGDEA